MYSTTKVIMDNLQVIEEAPKEETRKVGVRFAPEPEMEDIQTKTEVSYS